MRITIDLMKKSTQIIDLSNAINPRVGDEDLQLPLHISYGDNLFDMRGKDVEFLSKDPNNKNIYIAGTCNTHTPGDNLLMGDLTFRFPAGTFQADGTYDPDQTMFRIVDKETQKVISSVNVKITVMQNAIEFNFDPDKTSYDSRLENMLHDFHDQGQSMLDEIKDLNNQAKSNVSGDTAATANEAKQQANANAGDISALKGEVTGARGRFTNLADHEDAQDVAINQLEDKLAPMMLEARGTSKLPVIKLNGDTSAMTKDHKVTMTFEYYDGIRTVKGYSNTSWQGDSSLSQNKKAYRIRLFSDMNLQTKMKIKPNAQIAEDNQFNLKAYATDPLIGRDQVNATIGGEMWSTRDDLPSQLVGTNNFGFITGFPVLVYINGQFHGVHSFNTAKADYGTDFTSFEGEVYSDATQFNALPTGGVKFDGTDFDMVNPDKPTDDLKTKINNFITFVATSSDADYKAKLNNYVSAESVIDYIIFANIINNTDMAGKNEQFILYSGTDKFYMHPYDLDCTFGMSFDGSLTTVTEDILAPHNKLLSRTLSLFSDEVKARYTSLRTWLTAPYVINKYKELVDSIGEGNYEAEYALWKNNYSDFNYLKSAVYKRFQACDTAWLTSK